MGTWLKAFYYTAPYLSVVSGPAFSGTRGTRINVSPKLNQNDITLVFELGKKSLENQCERHIKMQKETVCHMCTLIYASAPPQKVKRRLQTMIMQTTPSLLW